MDAFAVSCYGIRKGPLFRQPGLLNRHIIICEKAFPGDLG